MSEKKKRHTTGGKQVRPLVYDPQICIEICNRITEGESIKPLLRSDLKYPDYVTFCQWRRENQELSTMYAHARENKAEDVLESIDEILLKLQAGTIDPSAGRVILDTLKWKAAKFYPKMYGEKLDLTTDGEKLGSEINVVIHEPKD